MGVHETLEVNSVATALRELAPLVAEVQRTFEAFVDSDAQGSRGDLADAARRLGEIRGTLELLDVHGGAMLADELRAVAMAVMQDDIAADRDSVIESLLKGVLRLGDYLERVRAGRRDSPPALLPLINELRAARKADSLSRQEVFLPDLSRGHDLTAPPVTGEQEDVVVVATRLRPRFRRSLLNWYRGQDVEANLQKLGEYLGDLAAVSVNPSSRRLWGICGALTEALADQGLKADNDVQRLMGRVERLLSRLSRDGEAAVEQQLSVNLLRGLLYHVSEAGSSGQRVLAVRKAYDLTAAMGEDSASGFSGPDRNLLSAVADGIREDIATIKDAVEIYVHSEDRRKDALDGVPEQLTRLADTFSMLGLQRAHDTLRTESQVVKDIEAYMEGEREDRLQELADELLRLEGDLDQLLEDPEKQVQFGEVADDVPLAGLRRLPGNEFRGLLSATVGASLENLAKVREALAMYCGSDDADSGAVSEVPGLLNEVAGALWMLPLPEADRVLQALRHYVLDEFLEQGARPNDDAQVLIADIVAGLEYYLEAVDHDRAGMVHLLRGAERAIEALDAGGRPVAHDEDEAVVMESPEGAEDWPEDEADGTLVESVAGEPEEYGEATAGDAGDETTAVGTDEADSLGGLGELEHLADGSDADPIAADSGSAGLAEQAGEEADPCNDMGEEAASNDDVGELEDLVDREGTDAAADNEVATSAQGEKAGAQDDAFDDLGELESLGDLDELGSTDEGGATGAQAEQAPFEADPFDDLGELEGLGERDDQSPGTDDEWAAFDSGGEADLAQIVGMVEEDPDDVAVTGGGGAIDSGEGHAANEDDSLELASGDVSDFLERELSGLSADLEYSGTTDDFDDDDEDGLSGLFEEGGSSEARDREPEPSDPEFWLDELDAEASTEDSLFANEPDVDPSAAGSPASAVSSDQGRSDDVDKPAPAAAPAADADSGFAELEDLDVGLDEGGEFASGSEDEDEESARAEDQAPEPGVMLVFDPRTREESEEAVEAGLDSGPVPVDEDAQPGERVAEGEAPVAGEGAETEASAQESVGDEDAADSGSRLAILGDDVDEEIVEVFIEEALGELDRINEYLPKWRANYSDEDSLIVIRRAFHTLKGGGRLIGAELVGEFSWAMENLLNRIIDHSIDVTQPVLDTLDESTGALPQLIEQLQGNRSPIHGIDELIERAHALSRGESGPPPGGGGGSSPRGDAPGGGAPGKSVSPTSTEAGPADISQDSSEAMWAANEAASAHVLSELDDPEGDSAVEVDIDDYEAAPAPVAGGASEVLAGAEMTDGDPGDGSAPPGAEDGAEVAYQDPFAIDESEWADAFSAPEPEVSDEDESEWAAAFDLAEDVANEDEEASWSGNDGAELGPEGGVEGHTWLAVDPVAEEEAPEEGLQEWHAVEAADDAREPGVEFGPEPEPEPNAAELAGGGDMFVEHEDGPDTTLLEIFADEAAEHLAVVRGQLPADSSQGGEAPVEEAVLRALHTLHGSAQTAEVDAMVKLAGPMEHLLKRRREQGAQLGGEDLELLHEGLESLEAIADKLPELASPAVYDDLSDRLRQRLVQMDQQQEVGGEDDELLEIFLDEADELVEACEQSVQQWREDPEARKQAIADLQRALHTLKGGARMANVLPIADLTHEVESLIDAVNDGAVQVDGALFEVLQESSDALTVLLEQARSKQGVSRVDWLIDELRSRRMRDESSSAASRQAEAAADTPTDAGEAAAPAAASAETEAAAEESAESAPSQPETTPSEAPAEAEAPRRTEAAQAQGGEQIRVQSDLLDNLVNFAGEVSIYHSRLGQQMGQYKFNLKEFEQTVARLREQLRDMENETESQILYRHEQEQEAAGVAPDDFDPLEFDRYTRIQELSRSLAESVGDLDSIKDILDNLTRDAETLLLQQSRVSSDLQDGLMQTRMVRFDGLRARFARTVRQTARSVGKQVEISMNGGEIEVDRSIQERIIGPLEHVLRNAVSHGIESREGRRRVGKPDAGAIAMDLHRGGTDIVIEITDDGGGIDPEKVRKKAEEKGLIEPGDPREDHQIIQLILETGFSTADEVTQIAGRGVGMDVVDAEIRRLGGTLTIQTEKGVGTRFSIRLPVTLAINQAVLIEAGEETYAIPIGSIEGVTQIQAGTLLEHYQDPSRRVRYADNEYDLYHLGRLLGVSEPRFDPPTVNYPVVMIRAGDERIALHVDQLVGRREVVVKPLSAPLNMLPGISGATIMADGEVVLILDVGGLLQVEGRVIETGGLAAASAATVAAAEEQAAEEAADEDRVPIILVVDDSITIRKVTGRVLARNGLEVATAKDGVDAVSWMNHHVPDLILLDIEMPRMDGYEVATYVRADSRLAKVPIIMITSRTGDKHRERAEAIGVDRYLGKPYQEGELMDAIGELITTPVATA